MPAGPPALEKETPFRLEGGGCYVSVRCGLTALRLPSNRLQLLALNKDEELYNNDYTEEEGQVDHMCVRLQNGWEYTCGWEACQIRAGTAVFDPVARVPFLRYDASYDGLQFVDRPRFSLPSSCSCATLSCVLFCLS